MSDKFNKTGLSSGSSWSLLTENTAFEETDTVGEKQDKSASATRLHIQDCNKFGICPAREYLQLAVCKQCQKLVILSSIYRHYELHHHKFLSSVKPSPPKRCIPSSAPPVVLPKLLFPETKSKSPLANANNDKSFIRIEQVNPNELNVKIEEVPLTIPQFNNTATKGKLPRISVKKIVNDSKKVSSPEVVTSTSVVSPQVCIQVKGNFKKIPHLKEKEYDVDKHCGVWIPEMEKNCTRSLTCKTHPLSLRRQVPGRSKEFDVLLAEHRARVALKVQEHASNSSSSPQAGSSSGTPINSPPGFDKIVFPTVRGPSSNIQKDTAGSGIKSQNSTSSSKFLSDELHRTGGENSQVFVDYISDDIIESANLPTVSSFPKPIVMNSFGGRQTDCKCRVFSRRMDHFRNAASSMLDRYNNSASTFVSMNPLDPTKVGKDGLKLAVQDPLQNGILYKQKNKSGKVSGTKRHLSVSENQGIMADSINYVTSSKRRQSSDISVGDPFSMTNPPNLSRSLSYPSHSGQHLIKVKELQRSGGENNLVCHRPKSNDSLTNNVATNSSEYLIISSSAKMEKLSGTTGSGNSNINSNSSLCHSLGITSTESSVHLRQSSFDQNFSLSKISAAPNITITQGMIVSLPSAALQNNQQNIYTIGTQIKDLLTNSTPLSRTTQHVSTPTTPPALKQALADAHISSFQNGIDQSPQEKNYNISFSSSDKEEVAPNITVTASSSLTGVLQGHVVSATLSGMPKATFKRLNSAHSDAGLLQQLVVQQSTSNRDLQQSLDAYKQSLPNRSPTTTQSLLSSSTSSSICNNPVISRQSFLNSPSTVSTVNNMQPMKHLQKMQRQQLQQQQLQGQQFIVHHGYQQQILPKIPTVPNNMTQYNSQQFSSSGGQGNLQFLTQAASGNSIQQQHGGALS